MFVMRCNPQHYYLVGTYWGSLALLTLLRSSCWQQFLLLPWWPAALTLSGMQQCVVDHSSAGIVRIFYVLYGRMPVTATAEHCTC
jgi:hypothetical protein